MSTEPRDPQTYAIIGAAYEVHKTLGPGFVEMVYQDALQVEFGLANIPYDREVQLSVVYKSIQLPSTYRADFVCYNDVIVELKALTKMGGLEESQVLNYLRATGYRRALLLNFGTKSLETKRFVS